MPTKDDHCNKMRNIHNVMTDLFDHIGVRENQFETHVSYAVGNNAVMHLHITLAESTFPHGVRCPKMVCNLQISREEPDNPQIVFLEKNTLFQADVMNRILDFLTAYPIDLN